MFGLMRAKKCGMTEAEKHFRRLNYCGTCKTIGSLYGQKARFLLNHDTVFLAEILSALGGEDVQKWQKSYQSFNCLSLPQSEMPFSLKFAATANVVLTRFKLDDHLADEPKRRFRFARRAFSDEFQKAESLLHEWRFPLAEVGSILASQTDREREVSGDNADEILTNLAEPTARATAIFFAEGVRQIGQNEFAEEAFALGYSFGRLVYLIDAFEDYEKDFSQNQFNAFRAAFNLKEKAIPADTKRKIASNLREIESEISGKIYKLPLAEKQKSLFVSRLAQNLQRKLKTSLPVVGAKKSCAAAAKPKKSLAMRWRAATTTARAMSKSYAWQMPLVFLFVFAFALVAPAQSREARSARECFELSFNLMALGAIFGAVLAAPAAVWQNLTPQQIAEKAEKKRREGWCDSCDCDCCDCCGCCGEGDCNCCGCDGCCCGDCCGGCDCGCDC